MFPYLLCVDGMSHITNHLQECNNLLDLYYIAEFLSILRKFFTKDILSIHKEKLKIFLKFTEHSLDDAKILVAVRIDKHLILQIFFLF